MSLLNVNSPHRVSNNTLDPFSNDEIYYGDKSAASRNDPKNRTFSAIIEPGSHPLNLGFGNRRASLDAAPGQRRFLIPVESTLKTLLSREDTDNNTQITIEDTGPKVLNVGTAASEGYNQTDIRGTYMLSNLLQELTLAQDHGRKQIILDEARLSENPVDRLARYIKDSFWKNLTRRIDGNNIADVAKDPKDWTNDPRPRVYVPHGAPEQYAYYQKIAEKHPEIRLDVQWLAKDVTAEYIRDLNDKPGMLAIGMDEHTDQSGEKTLIGKPFIVPGGRFNELYGWDSYMASLGLLLNDRVDLCKSMVENFVFCIEHYGKILNANRTYYLGRSQPPFLTDMTLRVYDRIKHQDGAIEFLRLGTLAAIKEYYGVWMNEPRLDERTGLSRYRPIGVGVPPETESTHFQHVLQPYADKHGISFKDFVHKYNMGEIEEPELDVYFLHDRAVRESGHDTSYRLEKVAADLATVDLNSCLYKIEVDIARIIRSCFNDQILVPKEFHTAGMKLDQVETSAIWDRRARKRRNAMDKYMWNDKKGMYFDYNTHAQQITTYASATTFWAMWAGVASPRQAAAMVIKALPDFEMNGGLVSGTEESRGAVGLHRPNRQWDYPFAWAPHQILAWIGFQRYGYNEEAQRLSYKWCHMVSSAFVNYNGVVVEKYDLTRIHDPQKVEAEYGNQGVDFKGVPREGFGWVNASYTLGLSIITAHQKRALGTLTDWEKFEKATQDQELNSKDFLARDSDHHNGADPIGHGHINSNGNGSAYLPPTNGNVTATHHLPHAHAQHSQQASEI